MIRRLFGGRVTCQVSVGLSVLGQLGVVVNIWGHSEAAFSSGDVGVDVGGSFNLFQIASDRRGAAASGHVWNVE